jgi:hypothetical protein
MILVFLKSVFSWFSVFLFWRAFPLPVPVFCTVSLCENVLSFAGRTGGAHSVAGKSPRLVLKVLGGLA